MRLLLDTHVFIWWESDPEKLPPLVAQTLVSPENIVMFSLISIWELQIKLALGKMTLSGELPDVVTRQQQQNNLQLLPIQPDHIYALSRLAQHDRDPFDRLLVAQASVESLTLVTKDPKVQAYNIATLW